MKGWRSSSRAGLLTVAAMIGWLSATAEALEIKMVPPTGAATTSTAVAITPDGSIAVGDSNNEVLKFDVATGASTSLGKPSTWSSARPGTNGVTRQGGLLYISGGGVTSGGVTHGFWYQEGSPPTWKDIGDIPGGDDYSFGNGISFDGNFLAATSNDAKDDCAARFNSPANSLLYLSRPPDRPNDGRAYGLDITYAGSAVVGWGDGLGKVEGWYCVLSNNKTYMLPSLPNPTVRRWHAFAVSADGMWVAGASSYEGAPTGNETCLRAVRWQVTDPTNVATPLDLGTGYEYGRAYPNAISDYGHVIAGWHREANSSGTFIGNQQAFVWDPTNGLQDLRAALVGQGVDMTHWPVLTEVRSVSSDGSVLAGIGTYDVDGDAGTTADQYTRGFVVTGWPTPAIPAPPAPVVTRALIEGDTQAVVTNLRWDTTRVDLYKNGTTLVATRTDIAPFAGSVTITGLSPFAVGDYYTATQTGPGGTSAQSFRKACVMPAVLSIPPMEAVPPGPGFEGSSWSPYWTSTLSLSTDQNHTSGGAQSAKESANTFNQEAYTDLTPTSPETNMPIILTYWLYVDPASTNQTHYVRLFDFPGNGFGDGGSALFDLTIGVVSDESVYTNGAHPCTGCLPEYYQYRFGPSGGFANLSTTYMDQTWAPLRDSVAGWHKLQIKVGYGLRRYQESGMTIGPYVHFYADGLLGHFDYPETLPNIDSLTVGSKYSDALPGYYDDLSIAKVEDVDPVLPETLRIDAIEGQPITPYDVVGTDANDPDWLRLEMIDSLPAGLEASAWVAYGPNTGVKITITGTPEAGTAAGSPYYVSFELTDERGFFVTTGILTINISTCAAPPVVAAISPNTGVQNRSNVRPHPPYDGVPVPSAPVHATITGSGFVEGATVKLAKSGSSDIVATNVVVVSDTQITCDLDLSGAAPGSLDGAWDVVVTTCNEGRLVGGFTISMCFTPRQDADGDGDVDLGDFSVFQNCFNGPNRPYKLPAGFNKDCYCLDVGDNPVVNDIDLADFNTFQGCFNGPNRPPKAGC